MLVGVEAGDRLAENLADAIARVRTQRAVGADGPFAAMKTDDVIGAGEDHPLHAAAPRRLVEIVGADDIVRAYVVPIGLQRIAAEVDNRIDIPRRALDGREIPQIHDDQFLAILGLAQGLDVGQAQDAHIAPADLRARSCRCRPRPR